jgi:hypothetical protein
MIFCLQVTFKRRPSLRFAAPLFFLGPVCEFQAASCLHCRTPQKLLAAIEVILSAYEKTAGSTSMLGQAGSLMNPDVIVRMKDIQSAIRRDFT